MIGSWLKFTFFYGPVLDGSGGTQLFGPGMVWWNESRTLGSPPAGVTLILQWHWSILMSCCSSWWSSLSVPVIWILSREAHIACSIFRALGPAVSRPFIQVLYGFKESFCPPLQGLRVCLQDHLKNIAIAFKSGPIRLYSRWNCHSMLFSSAQHCTTEPIKWVLWLLLMTWGIL